MADGGTYGIDRVTGGVIIKVYVAPRSSTNKVVGAHNGALKVALTAPPVEGAANKALLEFLARALGVPKSAVAIVSGEASRHKTVKVYGVTLAEALRRLVHPGGGKDD